MAVDIAGFVTDLKSHTVEHGFHVHDERHFVESYSLRQSWEVDLHPGEACDGPLDLHLALDVDPRVLLRFEDRVGEVGDDVAEDEDPYPLPLYFNWSLPPLSSPPDLLILATDLAGIAGPALPLEVSMIDSFGAVSDASDRSLSLVGRVDLNIGDVYLGKTELCEVLDRGHSVSMFLIEQAGDWIKEEPEEL
ncbi:MAG: hypothetical protein ACE5MI_07685 [Acidimicrobiia bacterium]